METEATYILAVNAGSSSIKFGLYNSRSMNQELTGAITGIGNENGLFAIKRDKNCFLLQHYEHFNSTEHAVAELIDWFVCRSHQFPLSAIGHRVVQGGPRHIQPELVTTALLEDLEQIVYLAPNHLPFAISLIKKLAEAFPGIRQVTSFDTAFHANMPSVAKTYAIPQKYREAGITKYGFHGVSYQSVLQNLKKQEYKGKRVIIAHLGNGASMAAVKNGKSIDTTMGLSPIGGLMMGTRCGDLDPGVMLFMLDQFKLTAAAIDDILSKQSGLKAIGGTADMQVLLASKDADALLAIEMFCYQAAKHAGALIAAMGGIDLLVFTGGIGENAPAIRKRICRQLSHAGLQLSKGKNSKNHHTISSKHSHVKVMVVPADEELVIATNTYQYIHQKHQDHEPASGNRDRADAPVLAGC